MIVGMNMNIQQKQTIKFIRGNAIFDDIGETTIYYFYPNGVWDDDKLLYEDALIKYPTDQFNWIEIIEYKMVKHYFSDIAPEDAYMFYFNGTWDGIMLLQLEAEQKYPKDKFEWVLMHD